MESVGSNSPSPSSSPNRLPPSAASPPPLPNRPRHHILAAEYFADRISRALTHNLRLLHRMDRAFFVLGATGNVYTVTLSASPSCSCPDRTSPCKHILFVLLRVLAIPLDDACLRRRTLRPCQLRRLLLSPTSPDVLAGALTREKFHQLFYSSSQARGGAGTEPAAQDGSGEPLTCPVCLEGMAGRVEGGVVTCKTCGNSLHEECFARWKRSRGRRLATCVMCRARWREKREQEGYVNLAAYVGVDDDLLEAARGDSSCTPA